MVDIFLEVTGSLFAAIIFFTTLQGLRHHSVREQSGTNLVIAGFGLLFFGMLIDITDNFPELNYLVFIGDTEAQAFLEKVVGMLLGLLLLTLGFWRWIPSIKALEHTRKSLNQLNAQLDQRVQQRTQELEIANRQLTDEIAERCKMEEQLQYRATHDPLTDLPNRYAINEILEQQVSYSHSQNVSSAVMLLDLDDFKKINDHLGHEVGDRVLLQATNRLREVIPDGGILGRFGGDEFIVTLPEIKNPEDVKLIADLLLKQFRLPFVLLERDFLITVSIGIATYPRDGVNPQELVRHADSALHRAKIDGRNTYRLFTDDMNKVLARRLALEEQMHGALEREEFSVNYQPVIDLKRQCVVSAEALLRWNNPILGAVAPDEFIPVAERTGLIVPIGQFVLKTALQKTIAWRERSHGSFHIAVNISPLQFRDHKLASFLARTLEQTGLPGSSLELELTEGVLMDSSEVADDTLSVLHQLSIGLSMDDFGTGYSSLSYLRRYPFKTLKIDRSFISEIASNQGDRELVSATISMAHRMGLTVVAEGVETEEQLAFLRLEQCDLIQGYFYSKPLAVDDFDRYLDCWSEPSVASEKAIV